MLYYVYRCYTKDGSLLYVGFTSQLLTRLTDHRRTSVWWLQIYRVAYESFTERIEALAAERHAIKTEHPRYNYIRITTADKITLQDDEI